MAAVTRDGSVWTWGRATFGRLGHEYYFIILHIHFIELKNLVFLKKYLVLKVNTLYIIVSLFIYFIGESLYWTCSYLSSY